MDQILVLDHRRRDRLVPLYPPVSYRGWWRERVALRVIMIEVSKNETLDLICLCLMCLRIMLILCRNWTLDPGCSSLAGVVMLGSVVVTHMLVTCPQALQQRRQRWLLAPPVALTLAYVAAMHAMGVGGSPLPIPLLLLPLPMT